MVSERAKRRIDRLLDQIDEASELRDWETVGELSKDVLALDPDNADGKTFLAAAERRRADSETAHLRQATVFPNRPQASATTEVAPTSFANGRYQVKRFLGEVGKKKVYLAYLNPSLSGPPWGWESPNASALRPWPQPGHHGPL